MKQLNLDEQAKLFIDSDIESITTNDLCEWMDIEGNINIKKGMVQDAMAEEEESKMFNVVQRKIRRMMEKSLSMPTSHRPLQFVRCCLKQSRCAINIISVSYTHLTLPTILLV